MKWSPLLPRVGAVVGGVALAWALIPSTGDAAASSWKSVHAAPASFLQQSGGPAFTTATTQGSQRALPNSVMPFNVVGGVCSVDATNPGTPPMCSTNGAPVKCSAHCDARQVCSAMNPGPPANAVMCSVLGGGNNGRCSVLLPQLQQIGGSQCSAFIGPALTRSICSVLGVGGGTQFCSAQNAGRTPNNQCSTFAMGAVGGATQCSVSGTGPVGTNVCSVYGTVPAGMFRKQCSAFAANSQCSVVVGNNGRCTTFLGAPAGTCSTFATGGFCSVIGGMAGTACSWP